MHTLNGAMGWSVIYEGGISRLFHLCLDYYYHSSLRLYYLNEISDKPREIIQISS